MQYSLPKAIRADPSPDVVPRLLDEIAHPVAKTRQDPEGLHGPRHYINEHPEVRGVGARAIP
jgi:hypothetical protein